MDISGHSIIVTGASAGIGAAIASALARRGAHIALVARRADAIETGAAAIRAAGGTAIAIAGDVTDESLAPRVVERAQSELGALLGVVNNAGYLGARVSIPDYPASDLTRSMAVNGLGTFLFTRAALPSLLDQKRGFFVNISSYLGRAALPGCVGYVAGKFAVEGITQATAVEWAEQKGEFAAVTVGPGMVATDMLSTYLGTEDLAEYRRPEAVGEGVARLVETLTAEQNGHVLDIDPWLEGD